MSAPPKRCVIADDVRASRETVRNWLCECEFDCVMAENGQQAWELICDQPSDLLITDLEMPELSGLELLEKVRCCNNTDIDKMPVLVITSLRDGQTLSIVQQMGGDALLQKPLDKRATLSTILDLIAGRQHLQHAVQAGETREFENGVISPTLRRLLQAVAKQEG
jgi:CheY-like chemotaxis protein